MGDLSEDYYRRLAFRYIIIRCPLVEKGQVNLFFFQGHGKVKKFRKMVKEIRKSSKVRDF